MNMIYKFIMIIFNKIYKLKMEFKLIFLANIKPNKDKLSLQIYY